MTVAERRFPRVPDPNKERFKRLMAPASLVDPTSALGEKPATIEQLMDAAYHEDAAAMGKRQTQLVAAGLLAADGYLPGVFDPPTAAAYQTLLTEAHYSNSTPDETLQRRTAATARLNPRDPLIVKATPGARGIGDVAMLGVGCAVYNRYAGLNVDANDPDAPERQGGTIVEVISWPDDDGEVHRAFRTLSLRQGRPNFHVIQEDNADLAAIKPVDTAHVRMLIRYLGAQVSKRRGMFTPDEAQLVHWMQVLTAVLSPSANRRSA